MNQFEAVIARQLGFTPPLAVGGMDEAGRGAWAGPIVVAGVILPAHYVNWQIRDSKQLTVKQRECLFDEIKRQALQVQVVFAAHHIVDRYGPKQTTIRAMSQIASYWTQTQQPCLVLTDAEPITGALPTMAIIRGDQRSQAIAAASIIAKVTRDAHMRIMSRWFEKFGFSQHKGYGTKQHRLMLQRHGSCWLHRRSYQPVMHSHQLEFSFASNC